jgi:hypothetical protein
MFREEALVQTESGTPQKEFTKTTFHLQLSGKSGLRERRRQLRLLEASELSAQGFLDSWSALACSVCASRVGRDCAAGK